ncbi:hypothetical protein [Duganella radicis]|uniref:Uncharacterized protein n=1 Tax=Duganella radicis TaxID=551988 RepID=A0A6L6PF94_9BURK|nr:hypothetical protein [Duganella radicis]MTV37201.1 hypothetical protein [Duganella radicis]
MNNADMDDLKFIRAVARRGTHTMLLRHLDKVGDATGKALSASTCQPTKCADTPSRPGSGAAIMSNPAGRDLGDQGL